jgi:hypothetical protein
VTGPTGFEAPFVRASLFTGDVAIYHRDGVDWIDAPLPRRFHRCVAQTVGWDFFEKVERCACGAMRVNGRGGWGFKNERRS